MNPNINVGAACKGIPDFIWYEKASMRWTIDLHVLWYWDSDKFCMLYIWTSPDIWTSTNIQTLLNSLICRWQCEKYLAYRGGHTLANISKFTLWGGRTLKNECSGGVAHIILKLMGGSIVETQLCQKKLQPPHPIENDSSLKQKPCSTEMKYSIYVNKPCITGCFFTVCLQFLSFWSSKQVLYSPMWLYYCVL